MFSEKNINRTRTTETRKIKSIPSRAACYRHVTLLTKVSTVKSKVSYISTSVGLVLHFRVTQANSIKKDKKGSNES